MIDAAIFAACKSPEFGATNPALMDNPFWLHMVRTGEIAYSPRTKFGFGEWDYAAGPVWCFNRFGPTRTLLPDGRIICVGGEHEDYYDPDFCVYNDVIVVTRSGEIQIYGYPQAVFPPTDSHTATLCGDRLIIVGGQIYANGWEEQETPVFSLDLTTYSISKLETQGSSPGRIYRHSLDVLDSGRVLRVYGGKIVKCDGEATTHSDYLGAADLNLETMTWQSADINSLTNSALDVELPDSWKLLDQVDRDYIMIGLRGAAPIGHPLFAANVLPLAEKEGGRGPIIFRMLDGTGRFAVVDSVGIEYEHRSLPEPSTVFYDTIEEILTSGE